MKYQRILFFTLLICFLPIISEAREKPRPYALCLCAIFQNEAPYLREWIEFHRIQGVEHFVLFNNRSKDQPENVLKSYIKQGVVTLIDWPTAGQVRAQSRAYKACIKLMRNKTKWLMFIDTDEFLFATSGEDLRTFLAPFESVPGVGGVCVNWQMYGTSGVERLVGDDLLIEKLTWKGPRDYPENIHVKGIIRPERVISDNSPHAFIYKEGYFCVDPHLNPIDGPFNPQIPVDTIRINHYFLRDKSFAYGEKYQRLVRLGNKEEYTRQRIVEFDANCSVEEDPIIHQFLPKLKALLINR